MTVEIEVDGLPVTVNLEEYQEDPEAVAAEVRAARAALQLPEDDDDELAEDYAALTARYGAGS